MKRLVQVVSLLLTLVLLTVGVTAATIFNVKPETDFYDDCKIINYSENSVVPFTTAFVNGENRPTCVFEDVVKLNLTFTPGSKTDDYAVFMLKDNGQVPTADNIVYINQAEGASKQDFVVYPSDLEPGVTYNIYVSSQTDSYKKVGSLTVATQSVFQDYNLGDVVVDDTVDSQDALWAMRCVAQLLDEVTEEQEIIADVNFDGVVDTRDALDMLRYAAQMINSFIREE